MLSWDFPTLEVQLLVDEDALDFSVARPGNPKVMDQQSVYRSTRFTSWSTPSSSGT